MAGRDIFAPYMFEPETSDSDEELAEFNADHNKYQSIEKVTM